jgi:SAM-dependent methyltransferase
VSAIRSFDLIARPYRTLEYLTLGRTLERTRLHLLPQLLKAKNALVLGDGDGRFLAHLLAQNPSLHATAIDISAAMLDLLRERSAPYSDRLHTKQTNALNFKPPADTTYDLVVTHFFLDCLTQSELQQLTTSLKPALAPEALWVVSDFRIPPGLMQWPAKILVRSLYLAFRVLTGLRITRLPDHAAALHATGFELLQQNFFFRGLLTTELWRLKR